MLDPDRVDITAAEAAYLTLGSWSDMAPGRGLSAYCHTCDDVNATLIVTDYYLSLMAHGVVVQGYCNCCQDATSCTFGILDPQMIPHVLSMTMKNRPR